MPGKLSLPESTTAAEAADSFRDALSPFVPAERIPELAVYRVITTGIIDDVSGSSTFAGDRPEVHSVLDPKVVDRLAVFEILREMGLLKGDVGSGFHMRNSDNIVVEWGEILLAGNEYGTKFGRGDGSPDESSYRDPETGQMCNWTERRARIDEHIKSEYSHFYTSMEIPSELRAELLRGIDSQELVRLHEMAAVHYEELLETIDYPEPDMRFRVVRDFARNLGELVYHMVCRAGLTSDTCDRFRSVYMGESLPLNWNTLLCDGRDDAILRRVEEIIEEFVNGDVLLEEDIWFQLEVASSTDLITDTTNWGLWALEKKIDQKSKEMRVAPRSLASYEHVLGRKFEGYPVDTLICGANDHIMCRPVEGLVDVLESLTDQVRDSRRAILLFGTGKNGAERARMYTEDGVRVEFSFRDEYPEADAVAVVEFPRERATKGSRLSIMHRLPHVSGEKKDRSWHKLGSIVIRSGWKSAVYTVTYESTPSSVDGRLAGLNNQFLYYIHKEGMPYCIEVKRGEISSRVGRIIVTNSGYAPVLISY